MKILKWAGILLLAVVVTGGIGGVLKVFWLNSHGNEVISNDVREGFIQGSNDSCISSQSGNPANAGVPRDVIISYCSCVSNKMAEQMTNAEIAAFPKDGSIPSGFRERATAASSACLKATAGN